MNKKEQLYWEDVEVGDEIPSVKIPLTLYKMIMVAGSNRDFNPIHHNSEYAKASGVKEIYANNIFLQGMWERAVRDYIGLAGKFISLKGFRMKNFNYVGETIITKGVVKEKSKSGEDNQLVITIWSENSEGVSVGPGEVIVSLPSRSQ